MEIFAQGEHQHHYRDDQDEFNRMRNGFEKVQEEKAGSERKQDNHHEFAPQAKEYLRVQYGVRDGIIKQDDSQDIGKGAFVGHKFTGTFCHLHHRRDGDG